jgi:hypothetical protein
MIVQGASRGRWAGTGHSPGVTILLGLAALGLLSGSAGQGSYHVSPVTPPLTATALPSMAHVGATAQAHHPAATEDTISIAGVSPTVVALSWAESGDFCFNHYELDESTLGDGGPWTDFDTISTQAVTEIYDSSFLPGGTEWFRDIDYDCIGNTVSNTVEATNPEEPALTYIETSASSVELSWTNSASYGGLLGFSSYAVDESLNAGAESQVDEITYEGTTNDDVTGLSSLNAGTHYVFSEITTDVCNDCMGGSYPSYQDSNAVTVLGLDQPTAAPTSVDVGQRTLFGVQVYGGDPPYSYAWSGLPEGCSSGDLNPLPCTPLGAGPSTVSVTVTDSVWGNVTSLMVDLTVSVDPTISSFIVDPTSPTEGNPLTLDLVAAGGAGTLTYSYSSLPTGCQSSDTASLHCTPTVSGSFTVVSTVTDSNGGTATATLTVTVAPTEGGCTTSCGGEGSGGGGGGSGSGGGASSSAPGLPTSTWIEVVVVVGVLAFAVVAALYLRRKPRVPAFEFQ